MRTRHFRAYRRGQDDTFRRILFYAKNSRDSLSSRQGRAAQRMTDGPGARTRITIQSRDNGMEHHSSTSSIRLDTSTHHEVVRSLPCSTANPVRFLSRRADLSRHVDRQLKRYHVPCSVRQQMHRTGANPFKVKTRSPKNSPQPRIRDHSHRPKTNSRGHRPIDMRPGISTVRTAKSSVCRDPAHLRRTRAVPRRTARSGIEFSDNSKT
jgi:hypothetical protein